MELLEKDLEDMIFDAAKTLEGHKFLFDRGLPIHGKVYRQVRLGEYGVADLISVSLFHPSESMQWAGRLDKKAWGAHIEIFELKRGVIDYHAVAQAARYKDAIRRLYFRELPGPLDRADVQITLIGSDIERSDNLLSIMNLMPFVNVYQYGFDYNGIKFNKLHGNGIMWSLRDPEPIGYRFTRKSIKEILHLSTFLQYAINTGVPDALNTPQTIDRIDYLPSKKV